MHSMTPPWCWRLVLLGLAATAWTSTARGEEGCPETRSPRVARRLAGQQFAAGQRLYNSGDYAAALERFECSYRLVPHRDTLFNIARTAEADDNLELALDRFEALVNRYPDDPDREDVEVRIHLLERQLEARRPPEPTPEPTPAATTFGDTGGTGGTWEEPAVERQSERSGARVAAWVLIALGAASAIAGSVLVGVAASENEIYLERRDTIGWPRELLLDSHQRGLALEESGWAALGVGAAAIVASIVLFFVSPRRRDEASRLDAERLAATLGWCPTL